MEPMTGAAANAVTKVCRSGEVSGTVISAVAEAKGVDQLDLEPLYSVVDPDALNKMFQPAVGSPPSSVEIRFSMADCQVVVRAGGEVVVTPPTENDEEAAVLAD